MTPLCFYGMLEGKIPSPDFQIEHVIGDIEELNKRALNNELDVTAVSIHACAYMPDYVMLRSGGSFGIGYGPINLAEFILFTCNLWNVLWNYTFCHAKEFFYRFLAFCTHVYRYGIDVHFDKFGYEIP